MQDQKYLCIICSQSFFNAFELEFHVETFHENHHDGQEIKCYVKHLKSDLKLSMITKVLLKKLKHIDLQDDIIENGLYNAKDFQFNNFQPKIYTPFIQIRDLVKPYTCEICSKFFCRKEGLKQHEIVHKENQFQCNYCHKRLSTKLILKNHQRTKHPLEEEAISRIYKINLTRIDDIDFVDLASGSGSRNEMSNKNAAFDMNSLHCQMSNFVNDQETNPLANQDIDQKPNEIYEPDLSADKNSIEEKNGQLFFDDISLSDNRPYVHKGHLKNDTIDTFQNGQNFHGNGVYTNSMIELKFGSNSLKQYIGKNISGFDGQYVNLKDFQNLEDSNVDPNLNSKDEIRWSALRSYRKVEKCDTITISETLIKDKTLEVYKYADQEMRILENKRILTWMINVTDISNPFRCGICLESFSKTSTLRNHIIDCHKKDKDIFEFRLYNSKSTEETRMTFQMDFCNFAFKDFDLNSPIIDENYEVPPIHKNDENSVISAMKGDKIKEESVISSMQSQETEQNLKVSKRPIKVFQCEKCEKYYTVKSSLKRHVIQCHS